MAEPEKDENGKSVILSRSDLKAAAREWVERHRPNALRGPIETVFYSQPFCVEVREVP